MVFYNKNHKGFNQSFEMVAHVLGVYRRLKAFEMNQSEIGHLWFYAAKEFLMEYHLWFDTESWAKLSRPVQSVTYVLFLTNVLRWVLLTACIFTQFGKITIGQSIDLISVLSGGIMSIVTVLHITINRDETTLMIQDLEKLFHSVPCDTSRCKKWWAETRETYILQGKIFLFVAIVSAWLWVVIIVLCILATGDMVVPTYDMIGVEDYSVHWWYQLAYQTYASLYTVTFFSVQQFMLFDMLFTVGRLYEAQAGLLMEVCQEVNSDPHKEFEKFRAVLENTLTLRRFSNRLNGYLKIQMFIVAYLCLFTVAVGIISTLIQTKYDGISNMAIVKGYYYPLYMLLLALVWTYIGQVYIDKAETLEIALYEFNWPAGSLKMRKLLLLTMVVLNDPVQVDLRPVRTLNREMMADMLKTLYYMLNIILDVLL